MKKLLILITLFSSQYSYSDDAISNALKAVRNTDKAKSIKKSVSLKGKEVIKAFSIPYELVFLTKVGIDKRINMKFKNNSINIGFKEKSISYMFNFNF